jgi:hypothetical protein
MGLDELFGVYKWSNWMYFLKVEIIKTISESNAVYRRRYLI